MERGAWRSRTQMEDCLLLQPPLHSFRSGGTEARERSASLQLLGLPPSPQRVRATVTVEFEILAMLMEVRITKTGFTAPKTDPNYFLLSTISYVEGGAWGFLVCRPLLTCPWT